MQAIKEIKEITLPELKTNLERLLEENRKLAERLGIRLPEKKREDSNV